MTYESSWRHVSSTSIDSHISVMMPYRAQRMSRFKKSVILEFRCLLEMSEKASKLISNNLGILSRIKFYNHQTRYLQLRNTFTFGRTPLIAAVVKMVASKISEMNRCHWRQRPAQTIKLTNWGQFFYVCPVIDHKFRHHIVQVAVEVDPQTALTMLWWKSLSVTGQTQWKLTSIWFFDNKWSNWVLESWPHSLCPADDVTFRSCGLCVATLSSGEASFVLLWP